MMRRVFLAGVAALTVSACANDSMMAKTAAPTGDLVDVAVGAGSFNTLVARR